MEEGWCGFWEVRPHSHQRGLNGGRMPAWMPSNTDTLLGEGAVPDLGSVSSVGFDIRPTWVQTQPGPCKSWKLVLMSVSLLLNGGKVGSVSGVFNRDWVQEEVLTVCRNRLDVNRNGNHHYQPGIQAQKARCIGISLHRQIVGTYTRRGKLTQTRSEELGEPWASRITIFYPGHLPPPSSPTKVAWVSCEGCS